MQEVLGAGAEGQVAGQALRIKLSRSQLSIEVGGRGRGETRGLMPHESAF